MSTMLRPASNRRDGQPSAAPGEPRGRWSRCPRSGRRRGLPPVATSQTLILCIPTANNCPSGVKATSPQFVIRSLGSPLTASTSAHSAPATAQWRRADELVRL